jgi:putative transposase
VSVPARRRQVAYGRERGLSARRACTLFSVARSALSYQGRKAAKDPPVVERMKELSAQYPRYGYRRIRIFLGRDGYRMSPGRGASAVAGGRPAGAAQAAEEADCRCSAATASAVPAEQGMVLRFRVRSLCQRPAAQVPDRHGRVHQGRTGDRRRPPHSLRPRHRGLSRLVSARGVPTFPRSDNGPEFVSKALLSWIVAQGIGTALIEPGKPWQNGVTASFNGKFRDECLSLEWFRSRAAAKVIIEAWRQHYYEVRPHSSLGYLTPNEFVARGAKTSAPSGNGPGRCGTWGLRAPARCSTVPSGTNGAGKGSRLKLGAVRKIRAG